MTEPAPASAAGLTRPDAILLDFGGVLVETRTRPGWTAVLAKEVHALLVRGGAHALSVGDVEADIKAGAAGDKSWKNAMSRPFAPVEMTHVQFWRDYVAADWPAPARQAVVAHATPLCKRMGEVRQERIIRPGIPELLDAAAGMGVPCAVVSNALSGAVHRDFTAATGLADKLALEVYSDEAGVRKPNPEMIWIATRALDVRPERVWYVGDNFDRDVLCGHRAGVGATVLMVAKGTYDVPFEIRNRPDAVVDDGHGLLALLTDAPEGDR
ncbi:HAD family hydrolase [Actinomadura logoneensis]|uniref:HAD family hydrolase n=1 Tax=Actinomadura logoneensis TaxID=2293572 RepID=A0A372JRA7_9ACTN|nr:HAD family hydrolase [Actinomadura logoneensis]RFU42575.1 HAD family hydrolase [Actinomadura logoneensis]